MAYDATTLQLDRGELKYRYALTQRERLLASIGPGGIEMELAEVRKTTGLTLQLDRGELKSAWRRRDWLGPQCFNWTGGN